MNKNLISSLLVTLVFLVGAAVQFVRGKTIFAIVGLVLGVLYVIFTLIGYFKEKNGAGDVTEQEKDHAEKD